MSQQIFSEDLEQNLLNNGWERILSDTKDIKRYRFLAGKWDTCAVGQILGFPDIVTANGAADHFPEDISNAGYAFGDYVSRGDRHAAMVILHNLQDLKDEIVDAKLEHIEGP